MHTGYLTVIVVYFVIVLLIGVWGARRASYDSYTVADRNVNLPFSVGTFFATYISSATVIGFVGYTSMYGASIFPTYFWGFALGWLALTLIAGRMRRLRLRSVPSFFEARFGGTSLRLFSAVVTVVAFAFSVMTQLVAGSLVLSIVIGIDQTVAVILLSSVLIIYTVLGGLVSVVRTDFIQAGLITLAVAAAFTVALTQHGTSAFDIPSNMESMLQGSTPSVADMVALVIVGFGGVAAQPYYLHRFFSTRNVATARYMVGVGALVAGLVYFLIAILGVIMPASIESGYLGDSAIIQFGLQSGGFLGALLLVGIICAVQSTVDSALHLVGVNTTNDIVGVAKPSLSDRQKHTIARAVTAVLGIICTVGAIMFIVTEAGFITVLLDIWLGTLSSALLIPLYFSALFKWVSKLGALLSSVGGFFGYFVPLSAVQLGLLELPFHQIYLGFGISVVGIIVGSLISRADPSDAVRARFFGEERAPHAQA